MRSTESVRPIVFARRCRVSRGQFCQGNCDTAVENKDNEESNKDRELAASVYGAHEWFADAVQNYDDSERHPEDREERAVLCKLCIVPELKVLHHAFTAGSDRPHRLFVMLGFCNN
jgi:hypothetical protein